MQKRERTMLLPLSALALSLLVKAFALSGLQDFTEETQPVGFIPGKDRQYILTGTSFGEKGCIHQVKVLAEAQGGVFAIDVWRPDSKPSFTLASSMEFTPRVQTRTVFLLDASPPLQFEADDLIGFHLVDNIADFQVGWTPAPSMGLTMSVISTQGGDSPITTFPGSSWAVLKTTWPIVFLSTSDSGFCTRASSAADSQASTNVLEASFATSVSPSPPNEIVPASSATSTSSTNTSSATVDVSPDFPEDSPIPPGGIAGILVAAFVMIILVTSTIILIAVCHLKTRKASWSWNGHLTDSTHHPAMSSESLLINSLSTSNSPLIQGEEPRCAVGVVIQPNPAYSTTFTGSPITAPSVLPPTPANHSSPVVMQPNPAYSTALNSKNTAACPTVFSPALPNPMHRSPSLLTSNSCTSSQTKHPQLQVDEANHTYCSVSTCTADINVYDYIDH